MMEMLLRLANHIIWSKRYRQYRSTSSK